MEDLQMIRFHIDCSLGISDQKIISYLDSKVDVGMLAYEIAEKTGKPHHQGWFLFRGSASQFRDSIKNHKDFKKRLKGKFSFSQQWTAEFDNPLNMPRKEYFKRYMTKGKCIWLKGVSPLEYEVWEKEYKSIDQTKKETLVKDVKGKLNINQSLIAFVDAKLDTHVSKKLTVEDLLDLMIEWFGKNSKDLDDFIIIRKLNMLHLHFEKVQWIAHNKKRLLDKYHNVYQD